MPALCTPRAWWSRPTRSCARGAPSKRSWETVKNRNGGEIGRIGGTGPVREAAEEPPLEGLLPLRLRQLCPQLPVQLAVAARRAAVANLARAVRGRARRSHSRNAPSSAWPHLRTRTRLGVTHTPCEHKSVRTIMVLKGRRSTQATSPGHEPPAYPAIATRMIGDRACTPDACHMHTLRRGVARRRGRRAGPTPASGGGARPLAPPPPAPSTSTPLVRQCVPSRHCSSWPRNKGPWWKQGADGRLEGLTRTRAKRDGDHTTTLPACDDGSPCFFFLANKRGGSTVANDRCQLSFAAYNTHRCSECLLEMLRTMQLLLRWCFSLRGCKRRRDKRGQVRAPPPPPPGAPAPSGAECGLRQREGHRSTREASIRA